MKTAGILEILEAAIAVPNEPTCNISGSTIDYFIVSKSLAGENIEAKVIHGTRIATHCPVEICMTIEGPTPLHG